MLALGAAITAVIAGGALLIVDNTSASGPTQAGTALTQPSAPVANIVGHARARMDRITPASLHTGNAGPSGDNTGQMGTGSGTAQ